MSATIDYYLTAISPFTYLGHRAFRAVLDKHGAEVRVKPVDLFGIWEVSGAVPPAKRPPVRQRLRFVELQRIANFRGLPITVRPQYWPTDPTLADHTIVALVAAGQNPLGYMQRVFEALWVNEENINDRTTLEKHLALEGFDAAAILTAAETAETAAIRARNTEQAIAADAVGVPCYVLNGEPFFGQDRIAYLDHALSTGRKPFKA